MKASGEQSENKNRLDVRVPEELLRHTTRLMFESGRLTAHVAPDLCVRLAARTC